MKYEESDVDKWNQSRASKEGGISSIEDMVMQLSRGS